MEKFKKWYKNNKFKTSSPSWNEQFELTDRSYSVSDIEDYFENVFLKNEAVTGNPSIQITFYFTNKIAF